MIGMTKSQNSQQIIKSLEYMSNVFCESKNKNYYYKISAAYFNTLLFFQKTKVLEFDGLVYPSANTEASGMNVVLKKELVNEKIIYCLNATMYLIKRNPYNSDEISFMPASNTTLVKENGNLYLQKFDKDLRMY